MAAIIRQLLKKQSLAMLNGDYRPASSDDQLTNVIIVKMIERRIISPISDKRIVPSIIVAYTWRYSVQFGCNVT